MANSLLYNPVMSRKVKGNLRIELNNTDKTIQIILEYITYQAGKLLNKANHLVKNKLTKLDEYDLYSKLKYLSIYKKSFQKHNEKLLSYGAVIYYKTGFKIEGNSIRLMLSKDLKKYLKKKHNIGIEYLNIETESNLNMQITAYKAYVNIRYRINIMYEKGIKGIKLKTDKALAIDYRASNFTSIIIEKTSYIVDGREMQSILRKFKKKWFDRITGLKQAIRVFRKSRSSFGAVHIPRQIGIVKCGDYLSGIRISYGSILLEKPTSFVGM